MMLRWSLTILSLELGHVSTGVSYIGIEILGNLPQGSD